MTATVPGSAPAETTGQQYFLGPLSQVPAGEGRAFALGGQQVAVFHLRTGKVHATSAVCPHRGGPLADGQIDGVVVVCPLHLNAFELATGCSRSDLPSLRSYPVEITTAGDIVVTV